MGEERINVRSDSKTLLSLLSKRELSYCIPGWRVDASEFKNCPTLYFSASNKFSLRISGNSVHVSGEIAQLDNGDTIPYMIQYLLERERMKKGKFIAHAAGVAKKGEGVLILGKQGSGKTSTVLELCRKHDYNLIGNDLVVLGFENESGYLYDGTKTFRLRLTTVKNHNSDLKRLFRADTSNGDEWTTIQEIIPEQINVNVEKSTVPIRKIIYIHLFDNLDAELLVKQPNLLFSRVYLNQNFSAYIRGSMITPMLGQNLEYQGYLPSLDNESFHEARKRFIDWVIANPNYRYVSGSMSRICQYINAGR